MTRVFPGKRNSGTGLPRKGIWLGLLGSLLLVSLLAPFAARTPDGLERVAQDKGFESRARTLPVGFAPDYQVPGLGSERLGTVAAGVTGTLITFAVGYGLAALVRGRRSTGNSKE